MGGVGGQNGPQSGDPEGEFGVSVCVSELGGEGDDHGG